MKNYNDSLAMEIDQELFEIENEIDWLAMVSPTRNDERWQTFKDSNFTKLIDLSYKEVNLDFASLRKRLRSLEFHKIKHPIVGFLLHEKKEELDLFLDLVDKRNTRGFLATSISLFGGNRPTLLEKAEKILRTVPSSICVEKICGADALVKQAEFIRESFQRQRPDFDFSIEIVEDLNSHLMVSHGNLYIANSTKIPESRVNALMAHEVEVHVLTRYNGRQQPLRQLESGLAYYDCLQEGLAALMEYLSGNLPATRLRILAARVIASHLAVKEKSLEEIFWTLKMDYGIPPEESFDTAVRAKRGGGLTKDAVYLEGLDELLSLIRGGHPLNSLFLGKFSLEHRDLIELLIKDGVLSMPAILPPLITNSKGLSRLEKLRKTSLFKLYTEDQQ